MKKRYKFMIAGFLMFSVGIGGSFFMIKDSVTKADRYLDQKRESMLKEDTIFKSSEAVKVLKMENFPLSTNVKLHKSSSKEASVEVKTLRNIEKFKARIENNTLIIDGGVASKNDYDQAVSEYEYKEELDPTRFSNIFNSRKFVENIFEELILSGKKISPYFQFNGDYINGDNVENSGASTEINIFLPEKVDIEGIGVNSTGFDPSYIYVDDDMINNRIYLKDLTGIRKILYNGRVNNIVAESSTSDAFQIFGYSVVESKLEIGKLSLNLNSNFDLDFINLNLKSKLADEIEINSAEKLNGYDGRSIYQNEEEGVLRVASYLMEDYLENEKNDSTEANDRYFGDDFESNLYKKMRLKDVDEYKKTEELFSDEIESHFYNNNKIEDDDTKFVLNISVLKGLTDKIKINTPNNNVRLVLSDGYNPVMDVNTKGGIDFKYLLFSDIIDIKKIPKINEVKNFKSSIGEFEQKIDSNVKVKNEVDSPEIIINCDHLRILKGRYE